ncbi:MAG: MFS transporter [Burkholderiales bacterium]|nr:MFS transporter [Burkholderiales bacterium]
MSRQLLLLFAFRILRSVAAGMITIAFPYLVLRDLALSPLTLGVIYTSAAIGTALFGFTTGVLADVWGRRRTLLLVAIVLPASSLLVYLHQDLPWLIVAATLGGYSATGSLMGGGVGGAAQPIQTAIVASLLGSDRRTFFFSLFTFVAGMFAALGALAAREVSSRDAFLAATVLSGASVLLVLPLSIPEVNGDLRRLPSRKVIGQFSLTGMLNGFSQGLVTPFLIPFFMLVYGVPKETMGSYGFWAGAVASVVLLGAPMLDRQFGFVRAIALTRGLGALLVAALPLFHAVNVALAIYLLIPALRVAALPAQQRALTDMVDSDETGRALGVNQMLRLAASSVAVLLTGYLFSLQDFKVPFFLYAAIMLANIYLYFRFFGKAREQFAGAIGRGPTRT